MSALLELIEQYGHGHLIETGDEELKRLVAAMIQTGKPGEITIKLKLKPQGPTFLASGGDVSVKIPKAKAPESIFFADGDNGLTRSPTPEASADLLRSMMENRETK